MIDVEANIGLMVFLFAQHLQSGNGRIIALEHSETPRIYLQRNCAVNASDHVTIIPKGAG